MRLVQCPCCRGAGQINPIERPELLEAEMERIRQWCDVHSVAITVHDEIDLKFAARLIGRKIKTIYNWRDNDDPRLMTTVSDGRVVVPIINLAKYFLVTASK